MTQHCFSQYKVHLIHKVKDCKDLVFESVLVVLKKQFSTFACKFSTYVW